MYDLETNHDYIIFSVDQNKLVDFDSYLDSLDIGHKKLIGHYKGQTETSYIINSVDMDQPGMVEWFKDQESVLELGPKDKLSRRVATLVFIQSGDRLSLGRLQSVTRREAEANGDWTYDPTTDEYYICTEEL